MKYLFFALFMVSTCTISAQNIDKDCSGITGSSIDQKRVKGFTPILNFRGEKKSEVLDLLQNSYYFEALDSSKKHLFERLANDSASKKGVKVEDLILPVDPNDPNGTLQVSIPFNSKVLVPEKNSFTFVFGCKGKKADTIKIVLEDKKPDPPSKATEKDKRPYLAIAFISPEMMSSIEISKTCNLCDLRMSTTIPNRRDRVYSTDYIVTFDPMLTKDAYTICKHIFKKKNDSLEERYRKVGAKWFAPSVGSQIRFEIVNQPLTETRKITIDAVDVFNNGSTQFQGIINSQINTQIISRLNPSAGVPTAAVTDSSTPSADANAGGLETITRPATDEEKLLMLHAQLIDYISVFRLSSCTIDQHLRNLPQIISSVNKAFGTDAAGASSLSLQLKNKFADSASLKSVVDEIGNLFNLLKDLKPIAYTTIRAKNRDYFSVKTFDGNNTEISNENIRLSGGMKIDFSAGFVLTGLRDFTYSLKNDTASVGLGAARRDTSGNVIIKEDEGNNNVGVGIFTHFYPRISSHYNIGGTAGLMTSTNLNLRLMLGGSFMVSSLFGSNNRVCFSYGCVWGKVARLSSQYEDFFNKPRVINGIPEFYSPAAAPQPIQRNEKSWFFAITMNFGGN
ncbi:MAG: hypothetical protein ABI419_08710 [Ginsengibacter sp.]